MSILAQIAVVTLTSIKLLSLTTDTPTIHFSYYDDNEQITHEFNKRYTLSSGINSDLAIQIPCYTSTVLVTFSRDISLWPDSTIEF
jgi:hypothetical protein